MRLRATQVPGSSQQTAPRAPRIASASSRDSRSIVWIYFCVFPRLSLPSRSYSVRYRRAQRQKQFFMPLFEITPDKLRAVSQASFAEMKVRERDDLQRLLRTQVEVLGEDLYVVADEFGDWEDSRRRIDLLAVDSQANLVVIELKRTTDGGHMELQAIRYASMVSTITFERAVDIHAEFLVRIGEDRGVARERLLAFLGWDEADEEAFAPDVRIVLVSEDFSKELTTAVLWLRERDVDIRCIRLRPYLDGQSRLIDVQQIIPLPEVQDYQVQLREKVRVGRRERLERHDLRERFWTGLLAIARERGTRHAGRKPGKYSWMGGASGIRGLGWNYGISPDSGLVELYIDRGAAEENKAIFDTLFADRDECEADFGGPLLWERLNHRRASRIKCEVELGGYRSPETKWPEIQGEMVSRMSALEKALGPLLEKSVK
jgi:hypothetical protein